MFAVRCNAPASTGELRLGNYRKKMFALKSMVSSKPRW